MRFAFLWVPLRSHGAVVDVDGAVVACRDDLRACVVVLDAPNLGTQVFTFK